MSGVLYNKSGGPPKFVTPRIGCGSAPIGPRLNLALPLLSGAGLDALAGELEDSGMMDEAVDGSRCSHGIFEDLVPLREDQVGDDDDGLFLVAFGEKREEDLHLFGRLLDVADVVDDDSEALELGDRLRKLQVALRDPELGDQTEGRNEEDLELVAADPLAGQGGHKMALVATGESEAEKSNFKILNVYQCYQPRDLSNSVVERFGADRNREHGIAGRGRL
jgi:hypothetical protein